MEGCPGGSASERGWRDITISWDHVLKCSHTGFMEQLSLSLTLGRTCLKPARLIISWGSCRSLAKERIAAVESMACAGNPKPPF
jgi:hypothetical protein